MTNWSVNCANIWTGDPLRPWRRGMTIRDGRIVSLDEGSAPSSGHSAFTGSWILPGLIDAHAHLLMGGLTLQRLDLSAARSRDDFDRLIDAHCTTLTADQWLEAFGWNEHNWNGARPDHSWLRAAGARPAVAWRCDQHAALVNESAMGALDLRTDVAGGTIVREVHGAPTGLLLEQAAWQLLAPRIPQPSLTSRARACSEACNHLLSVGVTTVGAMEYLDQIEQVLVPARDAGRLTVRVAATVLDRVRPLPFARARAIRGDDFLRIIGFKSFADGTLGSSTAAMFDRYCDSDSRGSLMEHALEGTLTEWMREVLEANYSPSVHAIGDRALNEVLQAAVACDLMKRVRFEHAQTVHPDSIARFRNRLVSMQPFHKAGDAPLARTRLGTHRDNRCFQFRSFLTAGARLAFGSDWPIASADPLEGMRVAITGLALDGKVYGASANLTAHEAITAYTQGAAECLDDSSGAGTLAIGSPADFIVVDRNPLACDWMDEAPQVLTTVVGGIVRYDATDTAGNHDTTAATA